jgi:uncharacterized protein (DUF885 family)
VKRCFAPQLGRLTLAVGTAALVAVPGHRQLVAQDLDEIEAETDLINAWFEAKFEEQLAFSLSQQTFLGRSSDQIDEFTIEAFDARLAWQRASVAEMRAEFDYELLAEEARTSYDVWEYQLQQAEQALPYRFHRYVFDQMSAVHTRFPQLLITFHAVDGPTNMEAYTKRIGESARAIR